MFSSTLVFTLLAALAASVSAHETNAERFARGLTPARPRRLFASSTHAARTMPSGAVCSNDALSGYMTLRYSNGDGLLGYFNEDASSCTDSSSAAKFEYPGGCDTKTFIKTFGSNNYIGVYARSIVSDIVSNVSKLLFGRSEDDSDFSFTSSKMVSELFSKTTEVESCFVQTSAFKVSSATHKITQCWEDDNNGGAEVDLSPIACFGHNNAVSVQWVKDTAAVSSEKMVSVCPSGINVDVYLRFECGL